MLLRTPGRAARTGRLQILIMAGMLTEPPPLCAVAGSLGQMSLLYPRGWELARVKQRVLIPDIPPMIHGWPQQAGDVTRGTGGLWSKGCPLLPGESGLTNGAWDAAW